MRPRKTRQERLQAEIDELKDSLRKDERELLERRLREDEETTETNQDKPRVRRSTRTRYKPDNYYKEFASDIRRHYYDDMPQEDIDEFQRVLQKDVDNHKVLVSDTDTESESDDGEEAGRVRSSIQHFDVPAKFL